MTGFILVYSVKLHSSCCPHNAQHFLGCCAPANSNAAYGLLRFLVAARQRPTVTPNPWVRLRLLMIHWGCAAWATFGTASSAIFLCLSVFQGRIETISFWLSPLPDTALPCPARAWGHPSTPAAGQVVRYKYVHRSKSRKIMCISVKIKGVERSHIAATPDVKTFYSTSCKN